VAPIPQSSGSLPHEIADQGKEALMNLLPIAWLGTLLVSGSITHTDNPELKCEEIKQEIRHIQSKMRAGYTRAQGEKMEAELRKLRALRKKAC